MFYFFQDHKEQVKTSYQCLMKIFDYLEQRLLPGCAEKRDRKKSKERASSNVLEARQQREVYSS